MGLFDDVAKPSHYQFGAFQAVDVIEAVAATISDNVESVHSSHLLKYALRWPRKGGLKDLYKARWWLDRLISHVEHRTGGVKVPPPPGYDPASVAFRHGDLAKVCGIGDVPITGTNVPKSGWEYAHLPNGSSYLYPVSAAELAAADGCAEYGNPVTPSCATPCTQTGGNAHDTTHEPPWRLP